MRLRSQRNETGLKMELLYELMDVSRQAMFKRISSLAEEKAMAFKLQKMVQRYRHANDRRAGSRSLYYNLGIKEVVGIGVTKFEQLMSKYELTIKPLRIRIVTTTSVCQSWNYKNLIDGLLVNGINQAVAGDLTYVQIGTKVYYLFCLTDLYSARLVGMNASVRMRSEDAQVALFAWKELRGEQNLKMCIHHTDGGGQYFSKSYLSFLAKHEIRVSVAQNCLDNGYAEQRNALLKYHLIPCKQIASDKEFDKALREIEYFYNCQRKQEKLGWRTPEEFEQYTANLPLENRPCVKLFEGKEKGFLRHRSTKS